MKVSKNLRRLRKEKSLTQEQVADALHITRQAISNWENDKTQPDLSSLEALAEFFGVEIEELLYGEKRQVGTEVDTERQSFKIRIILSVVGAVFIGIGLVLIFVNFWREFPFPVRAVFSVLPLLVGQAFAAYVFFKRSKDISWRECAAMLWCIGIVSTVALLNDVFSLHFGFSSCMFLDIVFCLPVFFILQAVSPLIFYFGMVTYWASGNNILLSLLLLLGGLLFSAMLRRKKADVRYKYTVWVSVLGTVAFWAACTLRWQSSFTTPSFALMLCLFLAILLLGDRDLDYTMPFQPVGAVGIGICFSVAGMFGWETLDGYIHQSSNSWQESHRIAISTDWLLLFACLAVLGGLLYFRRSTFADNLPKTLLCCFTGAGIALSAVIALVDFPFLWLGYIVTALAFAGGLIYTGLSEMKLLPANLGLVLLCVQLFLFLQNINLNPFYIGLIFVGCGIALVVLNYEMHQRKKETEILARAEQKEGNV